MIGTGLAAVSLVLPRVTSWSVLRDPASPLVLLIDVRAEGSVHTWFNVALLTVGGLLHAGVGALARRAGSAAWPWALTAAALLLLSLDDLLAVHEQLDPLGRALGGGSGALHFAWVLPGLVLGAGLVAVAVLAAQRLPAAAARWLLLGVAALLLAAVGLESVGGVVLDSVGDGPLYILVSHGEELLETWAAGALLCAAVAAVRVCGGTGAGSVEVSYPPDRGEEQVTAPAEP